MTRRRGGSIGRATAAAALWLLGIHGAGPARAEDPRPALPPPVVRPGPPVPARAAAGPGHTAPPAPSPTPEGLLPEEPPGPPPRPDLGGPARAPLPGPAPARPPPTGGAGPGDFVFEVERPGGLVHRFDEGPEVAVLVLVGNPRIHASPYVRADGRRVPEVSVKANTMVVWVDLKAAPSLAAFQGLGLAAPAPGTPAGAGSGAPAGLPGRSPASLFQEAVLGIYAEGAGELRFGDLTFRGDALYLEPRTYRGLLVEPRLTAFVQGKDLLSSQRMPIYLRARRGRLVGEGLTVFDDAELATARAEDRIELRVRRVTVEDYVRREEAAAAADEPRLLGFRSFRTQRLRTESVVTRVERVPVFYWSDATLGPAGRESFPVGIRGVDGGKRSNFGWWGTVGVGGSIGPEERPVADWVLRPGAYLKRGVAGSAELEWDHPGCRGAFEAWGVDDRHGEDRDGFEAPEDFRWRLLFENRAHLARDLLLDVEYADFSDSGVNREFFQSESYEHKDYETDARLKWTPGPAALTLVGKPHVRDFVTETTEEPQAALWLASVPLAVTGGRGGPALDLTSVSRAGRLGRRFADDDPSPDYEAWRFTTDTLANLAVDLGDVRLTAWAGPSAAAYQGRTDGEPDLVRTALLAGARANLQMWRVFPARGGPFQLDGLRHVIDTDVEFAGRFLDSARPDEVPFFDRVDSAEEASAAVLRVRNRLQTHGRDAELRRVLDLETSLFLYPQDLNGYGWETPGAFTWVLRAQPREHLYVAGEGRWDFGLEGQEYAWFGAGVRLPPRLAVFGGMRHVRDEVLAPILDLAWRWSDRYALRFYDSYDFRQDRNTLRLLFRRYSEDHIVEFGVTVLNEDDVSLELSFEPAIGGRPVSSQPGTKDMPDLDPWRAFPQIR